MTSMYVEQYLGNEKKREKNDPYGFPNNDICQSVLSKDYKIFHLRYYLKKTRGSVKVVSQWCVI